MSHACVEIDRQDVNQSTYSRRNMPTQAWDAAPERRCHPPGMCEFFSRVRTALTNRAADGPSRLNLGQRPSWRNEHNTGEIRSIPSRVPRDQRELLNFRVRTDIKIGQRRTACATRAAILKKRLRRKPPGLVRQGRPAKYARVEPPIKIARIRECGREFRVDDRIDEHRPASRRRSELFLRPRHPLRVGRRDVEQHVGVDEKPAHGSLRCQPHHLISRHARISRAPRTRQPSLHGPLSDRAFVLRQQKPREIRHLDALGHGQLLADADKLLCLDAHA